MSSRLLSIEGIYDGKSIKPLEAVKTSKKHRVIITFLDEPADSYSEPEKADTYIPEELVLQLQPLANAAGADDVRSYIVGILESKVQAAKDKEFVFAATDEIRAGMIKAGIGEEEILEDFNRFRRTLPGE